MALVSYFLLLVLTNFGYSYVLKLFEQLWYVAIAIKKLKVRLFVFF